MAVKPFVVSVSPADDYQTPDLADADIYRDAYSPAAATASFRVEVTLPPATVGFSVNITEPSGQRVWTGSVWSSGPLGQVWTGTQWR